jgi:hypothetical protein
MQGARLRGDRDDVPVAVLRELMRGALLACCEERGDRTPIDNREMNVATPKAAGEPGLCRH